VRFHRLLGKKYDTHVLEQPDAVLQDRLLFWASWGALLLLIIGYIIGSQFHLPISYIAGPIALSMVLLVQVRQIRSARSLLLAAPWSILFYALAMFVVITAAYYAHVLSFLTVPLRAFVAPSADVAGAILSGSILALLSAAANNLPATLIGVLVLHMVPHPNLLAICAMILGVDVGPKFTPFGSLATLLWLDILRRNGIRISWLRYFYENWWITLVTLGMSFVGLVVSYALFK
jgi:arsenical pump membrane protein